MARVFDFDFTAEFAAFPDASDDHPYLTEQPIRSHGFKQNEAGNLVFPMCDPATGRVVGWEEVLPPKKGESKWGKKARDGSRKKGNGFLIGEIKDKTIMIAEGVRSAASGHECSGHGWFAAFGTGNIVDLAVALRQLYPYHRILLCCDNDEAGKKVATEAARLVNGGVCLPDFAGTLGKNATDFNDLHFYAGAEEVKRQVEEGVKRCPIPPTPLPEPEPIGYPWGEPTPRYTACMEDLAASCGSAAEPAMIMGLAILKTLFGRMILICPTSTHTRKLIDWFMDVRESGAGKTPILKLLTAILRDLERIVNKEYKERLSAWKKLSPKEQGDKPWRRFFVLDNATIESLRNRLAGGHGGFLWSYEEGSAAFTSQGQYKRGGGDDKENTLKLFDGEPFNVGRSQDDFLVPASAISIVGGTQPKTLMYCLQKNNDLMMMDGTLFRFQLYYEPQCHYPRKKGGWLKKHKDYWEGLVRRMVAWADDWEREWAESGKEEPLRIDFDPEAYDLFYAFNEKMNAERFRLDDSGYFQFSNYISKATAHLISTAGILHIIKAFEAGVKIEEAGSIRKETVRAAARLALFHLGQAAEFFGDMLPKGKGNGDRFAKKSDRSVNQEILRKSLLVKRSDCGDRCDCFALEELFERVKEKGFITVEEIGEEYRKRTHNDIGNESISKYLRKLGFNVTRKNKKKGIISLSDYLAIIGETVTTVTPVTDDMLYQRLRILNEWQEFLQNGHQTVTKTVTIPSDPSFEDFETTEEYLAHKNDREPGDER